MKKALKQLLNSLDKVFEDHEELGDTDVRERLADVIQQAFIDRKVGYVVPDEFGMFSDEGNEKVKSALAKFLAHPDVVATGKKLATPKERLDAFANVEVESSEGNTYDEYFGSWT